MSKTTTEPRCRRIGTTIVLTLPPRRQDVCALQENRAIEIGAVTGPCFEWCSA